MQKKRIVVIGPVYPYKGGISHYTSQMYQALKKNHETIMVSYKMQYPKILFKKEQRDYLNDSFKIEPTNYLLNTANPFNWILSAKKIKQLKPDLIIIQWWHPYFVPCYWALCKFFKKEKILFICHNVFPHERHPFDRQLTKLALKNGDFYIVQSKTDAEDLQKIVKHPVFRQTVHPTYNAFKFENIDKTVARLRLGIEKEYKILLFFGFVRQYKGLKYLLNALPDIVKIYQKTMLLVVGDFGSDKEEYEELIRQNKIEDYVNICEGYIPDREVGKYFAASDLVVLPYESATQSGIVQIAFGFEKPVIVTAVGGLPDVVTHGKTGYVVESRSPGALAEAVIKFYSENKEKEFASNVRQEAYRFSWDRMVEAIEELCK